MPDMSRADFTNTLQDGLDGIFLFEHEQFAPQWQMMYTTRSSEKAYEELASMIPLGGASVKPEGESLMMDSGGESWKARFTHETVALGFSITQEAVDDQLYGDLGERYAKQLARSHHYTKETKAAAPFNNAFNSSFPGGDGVELCGTHTLWDGSTLANELAVSADLSEEALEDKVIAMRKFVDDRGKPIHVVPECLLIPPDLEFVATRILASTQQPDTGDNNINALRYQGSIPKVAVNVYLTDTDAYFLLANDSIPEGMLHYERQALTGAVEGDFATGSVKYKQWCRYVFGWGDWRSVFGSPGA